MGLSRTSSVGVGLAAMGLVWGVYGQVVPTVTDIRTVPANNTDITSAERAARYGSAALVLGITIITRDGIVFIMGATAVIMFSWIHRHANMVDPNLGKAVTPSSRQVVHGGDGTPAGYSPSN